MKVIYQVFLLAAIVVLGYHADDPSCTAGQQVVQFWAGLVEPAVCQCIEETGADPVQMDFWIHYGEYPNNSSLKCGIRCIYIALGISDENNNLNITFLKSLVPLPDEVFDPILDKCTPIVGTDQCDRFYELDQCMFTAILDFLCPSSKRNNVAGRFARNLY